MAFFFKAESVIGIDIGTSSIKLVQLKKSKDKPKLEAYGELQTYGHFERPNNAIQTSSSKMMEEQVAEMVKDLIKESGASSKDIVMSLPLFSSFVTTIEMPFMSEAEYKEAIPYEAKRYVPVSVSDVELIWEVIKKTQELPGKTPKVEILLVAVPRDVINRYLKIAKILNLNLLSLELESFCLVKSLVSFDAAIGAQLVLDIGTRVTNMFIVDSGKVVMVHNSDTGGGELTQVIANSLNIDYTRAEEFKKNQGIKAGGEKQIADLIYPFIDLIIDETERLGNAFYKKYNKKIEKIILTGGTALMPDLVNYVAQKIGTEVTLANPFSKISYPNAIEPIIKDLSSGFGVALGAAIKGLELK